MATSVSAQTGSERLCDNSFEDCRAPILELIRNERVGLDVSYWFLDDWRYSSEIIKRHQAGVPVRILLDLRADQNYPAAVTERQKFIDAGIPIRHKVTTGINHWKMMLYAGQRKVHFSAANFANGSYSYVEPYRRYVDEAIYFTDDPSVVETFMRRYDDNWTNTTHYRNLANIAGELARHYDNTASPNADPELNFPPAQDYQNRLIAQVSQESVRIDVVIFRITSGKVPDELIRRKRAGVPVRLITDKRQYRNTTFFWHSYNIDRMYREGIPIKWKDPHYDQDVHQKSVVLHGRKLAVFGSSNWSSGSAVEHNYFTSKAWIVQWFKDQFVRKWDNRQADAAGGPNGPPIDPPVFVDYEPGWPEKPVNVSPAHTTAGLSTTVTLRWEGGWWAHLYDVYLGTSSNPTERIAVDFRGPAATAGVKSTKESFTVSGLAPGTTYYWKIRGKTMLGDARAITGPVWSFTTAGDPVGGGGGAAVLADAYVRGGQYAATNFGSSPELITKFSTTTAYLRESYLKLDISSVSPGDRVSLRLAGWLSDTRASSVTTHIYHVSSSAWLESGITWNNKPAAVSSPAASLVVSGTATRWYQVDLTNLVQAQRSAGQSTVSIVLKNTADTLPYVGFGSRESVNKPELVVTAGDSGVLADAYVRGGQYAATNYGSSPELIAKFSTTTEYLRESYLKLDISSVPPGDTVTLRLAGRLSDTRAPSVTTNIYHVSSTAWLESGITWNNKPVAASAPAASLVVSGTATQWYQVDVTNLVQAQRSAGESTMSIVLKNTADTLPYVGFGSRESANKPELVVTP